MPSAQDVHLGVQLIYQYFQVIPPVRPATQAHGGSYALWLRDVRELIRTAAEYGSSLEAALRLTYNSWNSSPFPRLASRCAQENNGERARSIIAIQIQNQR